MESFLNKLANKFEFEFRLFVTADLQYASVNCKL